MRNPGGKPPLQAFRVPEPCVDFAKCPRVAALTTTLPDALLSIETAPGLASTHVSFFQLLLEFEPELGGDLREDVHPSLKPRAEEVHGAILLPFRDDKGVDPQHVYVVRHGPVVENQLLGKLIEVKGSHAQFVYDPCPIFSSPRASENVPENPLQFMVFSHDIGKSPAGVLRARP